MPGNTRSSVLRSPRSRRFALRALAPLAVLLFAAQLAAPARGALFDDDEARRRIEDLKNRVDLIERSLAQRLDALEAKAAGLADLFRDVEQIKSDIAKLRGQYEVLTYELEQAQKRQRDLYLDLDGRVRKLEGGPGAPGAPATPGAPSSGDAGAPVAAAGPAVADPASEQKSYDAALEAFKSGNFGAAVGSFQAFIRAYPKSPLAPSAMYWAGNAQYAQREFRPAIATQRQLIATYPDSQKVPDALLNIASCQVELGDTPAARRTLEEVVAKYPTSEAATKARQRLSAR
ncbi:MAG TPA: tol-pal system protein YbgF [Casimicrobiaceae bacterium]|nr:tol-pal system protein YbgF [Casimicrobiaceae bacterium]